MNTLAAIFLLQAAPTDDAYAKLSLGDRVRITFRHGATVTGTLIAPNPKVTQLDFQKESRLTIDMSWEFPGLTGTMTVPKDQIGSIKKIEFMDPAARAEFEKQNAIVQAQKAQDEKDRLANQPKPVTAPDPEPAPKPVPVLTEEIKKGLELRKKYPPDKWGAETYEQIRVKKLRIGPPLTPEQREFFENYKAWTAAGEYEAKTRPPSEPEKKAP